MNRVLPECRAVGQRAFAPIIPPATKYTHSKEGKTKSQDLPKETEQVKWQDSNPGLPGSQTQALNHYKAQGLCIKAEARVPCVLSRPFLCTLEAVLENWDNSGILTHLLSLQLTWKEKKGSLP